MKTSLKYLSSFLVLSFLFSCNGGGFKLNYDDDSDDEKENKKAVEIAEAAKIKVAKIAAHIISGTFVTLPPELLEEVEVNSPQKEFLLAASKGKVGKVKKILDKRDVDINTQDENGDTALIIAARKGHLHVVEELIRRGANKNRQNQKKQTALETAIKNRRRTVTLELIHKNDQSLNALNNEGQTALMVAIKMGQKEIAKALIKAGADLNEKDNRSWSALKYARKGKHKEIAEELLANGAKEYDPVKIAKNAAKSLFKKAAEKAPEVSAAALL